MIYKLVHSIQKLDMFGQNISLNIKGKESYKSSLGGVISLGIYILLILILISRIQIFI